MPEKHILIILPDIFLQAIRPLVIAYKQNGISSTIKTYSLQDHLDTVVSTISKKYDAALLVGSGNRAPRTVLNGPFLSDNSSKRIPVGWLPVKSEENLHQFVNTAIKVHSRKKGLVSTAILAQRHPRFLKMAIRMETILKEKNHLPVYKWTSDLLVQEEMIRGLRTGLGCAIYFGHGRPNGWVGYYGTRIHHFTNIPGEPLGAVLSLCCLTASRKRTGMSFSEALLINGVAAAAFGAVTNTLHTDNTRWAVRISDSLKKGINTLGDLILDACPLGESAWRTYRIIGDPLAPLFSCEKAIIKANQVKVYP